MITADGDTFPCEIRFTLLPLEDGEYSGMVGVARDISQRRRREQKLQVMTRVLRHNIRNKLGVVMGEAELLRSRTDEGEPPTAETIEDATRTIESTAQALVRLSEKVRTIQAGIRSRSDGPMRTDAAVVARSTVATLAERYPDADIEYDGPDSVWVTATDSLRVAIEELIENGVEHYEGDGDPRVRVRVDETDGTVRLAVTDRCPRLPAAERRVLRSEEETDLQHSAGVGLWLVYWVCRAADGDLRFEYTGSGNRIVLTLDAATPP